MVKECAGTVEILEAQDVESLTQVREVERAIGGLPSEGDPELVALALQPGTVNIVVVTEDRLANDLSVAAHEVGRKIVTGERIPPARVATILCDLADNPSAPSKPQNRSTSRGLFMRPPRPGRSKGPATVAPSSLQQTTLEVTVLLTLVVYWLAKQYAELLGQHTYAGRLPAMRQIRSSLAASWPMVSASFLPSVVLLVARVCGASSPTTAATALAVTVALLVVHAHAVGTAAGLSGGRLIAVTGIAGLLGDAMVLLKAVLQSHHLG